MFILVHTQLCHLQLYRKMYLYIISISMYYFLGLN